MKYDLSNSEDLKLAQEYFNKLISNNSTVEINKKSPARSYNQNNYLHLLLSYCALQYGETMEGFKNLVFKRWINKDIFETTYKNFKTGELRKSWKSSAELTVDEMRICIDRLIRFAAKEMELELPQASDLHSLRRIENEIEVNKKWL